MKIYIYLFIVIIITMTSCEKTGYHDLRPISKKNNPHCVIEVTAGTNKIYSYDRESNGFKIERKNGKDIKYEGLAMPFNYGFIPSTAAKFTFDKANPELDVVILGEKVSTSTLLDFKIIGCIQYAHKDSARKDLNENVIHNIIVGLPIDKDIKTIEADNYRDLTRKYRGQRKIIEIYLDDLFSQYNQTFYAWKDEKFASQLLENCKLKNNKNK